jgi:sortase A
MTKSPKDRIVVLVERLLLVAGLALLCRWGALTLDARAWQAQAARGLEAPRTAEAAPHVRPGSAVGRIEIPRTGLSAVVAEGLDARTLRRAVGHVPGSAFPGESGNVALAAHRDTYFKGLAKVRRGDVVRLSTPEGEFQYVVERTAVVRPERVDLIAPTPEPTLTLVTCHPFNVLGPAPDRFVVRARRVLPAHSG